MGTYNVDKIENWLDVFGSACNKYSNTHYSDFKNSYISNCSDPTIVKMKKKLNEHYSRIDRINSRVNKIWNNYISDLKGIDRGLAGQKVGLNDSTLSAKISKLPVLKEYKATFSTKINSVSASIGTVKNIGWAQDKNVTENLMVSFESLISTAAVISTSVTSGVAKLFEFLVDGTIWMQTASMSAGATLVGCDEWAKEIQEAGMDLISYDIVGEVNKAFYENTRFGQEINDASLIKYNSDTAKGIQNVSTKVAEITAATALTVATAGAAAPVSALIVAGTGFLEGAGEKAEQKFQNKDERDFFKNSGEIFISGGIKAIEFYSEGKMGSGVLGAVNAVKTAGGATSLLSNLKNAIFNGESKLFSKEIIKDGFKATFKDVDTYMDSIGAAFNNITYDEENGIKVDWKKFAKEAACNFALNSVTGLIGNSFETRMKSGMDKLSADSASTNLNKADFPSSIPKQEPDYDFSSLKKEYDELEGALDIKSSNIPQSEIYVSKQKMEADELVSKIKEKPIPALEKYKVDTSSPEYQAALKEYYSKPSLSRKQDLSQVENHFIKRSDLDLNKIDESSRMGGLEVNLGTKSGDIPMTEMITDGNNFYINKKTYTIDNIKSIDKKSRFKKIIVYITDDTSPNVIFRSVKKPKNVVVRVGDFEYLSNGNGFKINQWRNIAPVSYTKPIFNEWVNENLNKVSKILDDWGREQGVDNYAEKALRNYAKTGSVYDSISGKPYITNIGGIKDYVESLDSETVKLYLHNKTLSHSDADNLHNFFKKYGSSRNYTYGVDQGGIKRQCVYSLDGKRYSYKEAKEMVNNAKNEGKAIPRFKKEGSLEYFHLKDKLVSMGLTSDQASVILSSVDDFGACSYAAKSNSILYKFSDNPKLFEEKFGFPMYKVNSDGEKVLNSEELLLDMYLFANDKANGGKLLLKNSDGSYSFSHGDAIDVFGRKMLSTSNQTCMSTSHGSNNDILEKYLNSKGLKWHSDNLITNESVGDAMPPVLSSSEFDSYIDKVRTSIREGKAVQLNIFSKGNEIRMLYADPKFSCTTKSWEEGSGHAIFITGMNSEGFITSSWGREYLIPFKDSKIFKPSATKK